MRKVTFKEFISTVLGGIWQAVKWVVGMFGYKCEDSFGKIIKRIFAVCVTILMVLFTGIIVYTFVRDVLYREWIYPRINETAWTRNYISNHISFDTRYYPYETRLYDEKKGKTIMEDVDWVYTSNDYDSLAVFSKDEKRGYLNRFTGEITIPAVYTRAWVFSEGLAAAEKEGELVFINHGGEVVIDKDFEVRVNNPSYTFKGGYCVMDNPVTGKKGLIDRRGDWTLQPEFDDIARIKGFWRVEKDGLYGLYTAEMDMMLPTDNPAIDISEEFIEVRMSDHTAKHYDYDGNVLVDFVIDDIKNLLYETAQLRHEISECDDVEGNNRVYDVANCQQYEVYSTSCYDSYYGLISREGKLITPPIYRNIDAIDKNLYLCEPQGVIINDEGKIVE